MSFVTWLNHHRLVASGLGMVVLLLAALAGVWFFVLRSPGTQVDLRQALRLYRDHDHASQSAAPGLPRPGVYVYRTSGAERLSVAGISRSFPATSEMVVVDSHCASMDWVPFDEHTEGTDVCRQANGALVMSDASSVESIAGITTRQVIRCPETAYFVPADPRPGERWSATCHAPGQVDRLSGVVVGPTTITVDGQTVPVLHTRLDFSVSGQESGTNPSDYWVSPADGLILRQRESVDVSQASGPLGSVRYSEEMTITMSSLAPAR